MIVQVTRRLRKKRIVILGGGFGGVYAAIHLEKLLARQSAVEISLVSRDNFFLFTPMLHEIAASDLEITNIVNPLRKLLHKVEVVVGDVNEVDLPNKRVLISRGYRNHSQQLDYDHLVIALGSITNFYDLPGLAELLRRGRAGGIPLEEVSLEEARRIEPRVKTCERALFSPSTSSVDPAAVIASLERDLRSQGITVVTGTAYLGRSGTEVRTSAGTVASGYVVNAAGLYADRVARDYGFGERYQILPFKGLYLRAARGSPGFRTHIYPVPDLKAPFLGVHVTVTADGAVKIGPTAVPALWREHYHGVRSFSLAECVATLSLEAGLFLRNEVDFRRLAVRELRKCSRRALAALASELAEGIRPEDFLQWGRPGIRAQLFDLKERKLEMDFRFEGDDRSFHVLNAVSPAFTCALPFSAYLVDQIEQLAA